MSKRQQKMSSSLQQGNELNISEAYLSNDDLRYLVDQDTQKVTKINFYLNNINYEGMSYFSSGNWRNLVSLYLSRNRIGNLGCKYLTRAAMGNLQHLRLQGDSIQSAGLLHLSKAQWENLEQLCLGKNPLKVDAMKFLIKLWAEKLSKLNFNDFQTQLREDEMLNLLLAEWESWCQLSIHGLNFGDRELLERLLLQKIHTMDVRY